MLLTEVKQLNENTFPTDEQEIRQILKGFMIDPYTVLRDGTVDVDGNVDLTHENLTKIPVKFGTVDGYFLCCNNKLTSLEGCPTSVGSSFGCQKNQLMSLRYSPTCVGKGFNCGFNDLTSLEFAPTAVNGDFNCYNNKLISLKGAPANIKGDFRCAFNGFTSLEGIADIFTLIKGDIYHWGSQITSGGLGLVLIKDLNEIGIEFKNAEVMNIIQRYLGRPDDIFECQNELIENGFEEYAKL